MKPNLYVYCMFLKEQRKLEELKKQNSEKVKQKASIENYEKYFNSFMYSVHSFTMYD